MLSQRMADLFRLLQCTNSDIARFAGCSPSNVSRLKSGVREPRQDSRAVWRLAQGVYRYADDENLLSLLCQLCGVEDARPDALIPAVITWLYQDQPYQLPQRVQPKSKREEADRLQNFGARLDRTMTLLEYTNGKLAADLNVDASLVSRYRAGIYHPNRNATIRGHLVAMLLARANRLGRTAALATLCGMKAEALTPDALAEWLYTPGEQPFSEIAESLLQSIDTFTPRQTTPAPSPQIPDIQRSARYWGTPGLRSAVVRFLSETAREGGELLLYSDEPMDWMSADREFFALWAALMAACMQRDVHIRIIHNVDRGGMEMVSAIKGWLPLYISGKIEPYVFSKARGPRFYHTIFLRPHGAGILGFFPADAGENRWYDYIADGRQLGALQAGYASMLASASPFLKIYTEDQADAFWAHYRESAGKKAVLLAGLSTATLPETLLERMLSRADISRTSREKVRAFHRASREHLDQILKSGDFHELLCLPEPQAVSAGQVKVNFEAETGGLCLYYTKEEYAAHLDAVKELIRREKHYHLTLLPDTPFQDLQIFTMKDAVAIIRRKKPFTAFVFLNATLVQSVTNYCNMLASQFAAGRYSTMEALDALCHQDG